MTTQHLTYFNNAELPAWVVDDLKDDTGTQYDMSTGWTFTVTLARTTAPATALFIKSTGITASATAITVAWAATDWDGLEAAVNGTSYVVLLKCRRTSDSFDVWYRPGNPPTLKLKAAPGTSAVSPSSYPITVTAASVTFTPSGSLTATNAQTAITEASTDLDAHLADTVAHDASAISLLDAGGYYVSDTPEGALQEIGYDRRHAPSPQDSFRSRIALNGLGGPVFLTLAGDSTGNDTTDWFYPFVQSIAAAYPAWTVQHRLFNGTNQRYDPPTTIQTGTSGDAYLNPSGITGGATISADSATVSVTSADIRIEAKVRKTALVSGATATIASHFGLAGNRAWYLSIASTGGLQFSYTTDGSTLITASIASQAQMAALFTSGTDFYVGCTFDLTNGSNSVAQAIYSTDGTTWQNFGTAITSTTIAGFFDATNFPEVGGRGNNATDPWDGRIYWVNVYKGLARTDLMAWRFDAGLWNTGSNFVDSDGVTWNISASASITRGAPTWVAMNGSVAGAGLSYFDDATRRPKLACARTDVLIVNTGHNEATDMIPAYKTYVDNVRTLWPGVSVVAVKQNPEASNYVDYRKHALNMQRLGHLAAGQGWGVIDAFQAFQDTGTPDTYVTTNDVHPTAAGYALWTTEALKSFGFA